MWVSNFLGCTIVLCLGQAHRLLASHPLLFGMLTDCGVRGKTSLSDDVVSAACRIIISPRLRQELRGGEMRGHTREAVLERVSLGGVGLPEC